MVEFDGLLSSRASPVVRTANDIVSRRNLYLVQRSELHFALSIVVLTGLAYDSIRCTSSNGIENRADIQVGGCRIAGNLIEVGILQQ